MVLPFGSTVTCHNNFEKWSILTTKETFQETKSA
jgi:hypothetical protein